MNFVTIKKASIEGDLIVLKSLLEAEGIKCFLKNQYVTQIINYMPSFAVELQVPKEDVMRAIQILNELESDLD
jgi:transcription initiation factor TFIIIB Brf1 subunit/transcription initiation factor TFIIB